MVDDLPVIDYQTLASSKLAIDRGDVELEEERICLSDQETTRSAS